MRRSRWCARSTAPPTVARPRPAPSAATSRCPTARTWCTARTHRSPPSARSRSGSRTCDLAVSSPLSPTGRSKPRREKERAQSDRETLYDVLDSSLICHLGVVVDGMPLALPTMFAVDPDGPDEDGTLYIHGSVASRSLVQGPEQEISVTVTVIDG